MRESAMSSERSHPSLHLFNVPLWTEDLGAGQVQWRGQVQHVLSGEVHYFRDWPELEAYLMAMVRQRERANAAEAIPTRVD